MQKVAIIIVSSPDINSTVTFNQRRLRRMKVAAVTAKAKKLSPIHGAKS